MPELILRLDESTWQALQQRARRKQRTEAEEAAEIVRHAMLHEREVIIQRLEQLHQQLGKTLLSSSVALIREDRERR